MKQLQDEVSKIIDSSVRKFWNGYNKLDSFFRSCKIVV